MAELGALVISPLPKTHHGTILEEMLYSGEVQPIPVFAYMDTSLSVVIRFSEAYTSVNDVIPGDILNVESYSITGVRILVVQAVSAKEVRLVLNKAPVYSPNVFTVLVTANGIDESVSVMSIDPKPVEASTIPMNMTDIMVNRVGAYAGGAKIQSGDYALSDTAETVKKLVYEVMLVQRGEMLHDVEFGNKIRLKTLQNSADLVEQGRDLRSRIMLLPMIDSCTVGARYGEGTGSEVIIFTAKVKTKSGIDVTVSSAGGI